MMNAVVEAVQLLNKRRAEAESQIEELRAEIRRIDAAIRTLDSSPPTPAEFMKQKSVPIYYSTSPELEHPKTVKDVVFKALLSELRPWTVDELYDEVVKSGVQGDRDELQVRNTIRSALFNLRKEEAVVQAGRGLNMAKKAEDKLFADIDVSEAND